MAVMGTFEDHVRWCGIEYHWPLLINSNKRDIAIVDSVQAVHTRPVQTITNENYQIMLEYLQKTNLKKKLLYIWNVPVPIQIMRIIRN